MWWGELRVCRKAGCEAVDRMHKMITLGNLIFFTNVRFCLCMLMIEQTILRWKKTYKTRKKLENTRCVTSTRVYGGLSTSPENPASLEADCVDRAPRIAAGLSSLTNHP